MPRQARLDAPGVLHHVMGRGIEGKEIFINNKDRNDFINRLSLLVEDGSLDIYAWTLIPNHFHLLVKTKNLPLSSSMRKLLTGYENFHRRNYLNYVKEGIELGHRPELVGGGLIRSLGGWSAVFALRRRKEMHAFDSRILGDSDFVNEIKSDLNDLVKKNLRISGRQIDLEELAKRVCKKNKISLGELCSGSRRGEIVKARKIVSWIAVCELGYSGAEVARYLGVTNSCVTRLLSSGEKPSIDGIMI